MKVISYNSRILNTQEQKLSTLDRELLAIVYALQIYEFLIIGSPHPIYLFTDHKPLLHCFAKKGNLSPRFYRVQMQLTKFSKLKIIHTPGKNLTVADMLSRTFTKEQLQVHQLRHKQLPPQIDFSIMKVSRFCSLLLDSIELSLDLSLLFSCVKQDLERFSHVFLFAIVRFN